MISKAFNLLLSLLLLCCQLVIAQNLPPNTIKKNQKVAKVSFNGTIKDATTNEPLPGTSIYFADLKLGTVADANGNFQFSNISTGTYLVEISHLGYKSIIDHINLMKDLQQTFNLSESVVESEGVTVTGVSSATKLKRSTIPVSLYKRSDLLQVPATNLIDALSKKNGIASVSTGPAISKPVIRGLGYNRVVVLNDGVRQEGQQWGDEHGIEIDEYSVQKVEILKGPASLMYGSDAMAGVINILTNLPVADGTIKANITGNYQSNNKQRVAYANIAGNKNGFSWNMYGTLSAAQDYKNKYDGYVFNSKFNQQDIGGYVGYNGNWGYSHLLISNFNQKLGLIEGERDAVTGNFLKQVNDNGNVTEAIVTNQDFKGIQPTVPMQHIQHFKMALDNQFNLGKNKLLLNIGFQNNKRKEFGDIIHPTTENLFFDLNTVTYNAQFHFAETNGWKTAIGISGMYQTNQNKAAEVLIPEYNLFDAGGFIFTQKNFSRFTVSGGMRFDNRTLHTTELMENGDEKFKAIDKSFSNLSASAGISYDVTKSFTLKLNAAKGFRAPAIPELSSNGAHEGTNRYEYGNNNLKSETSWQFDAGAAISSEHVYFSASAFANIINNFIFYNKLASSNGGDSTVLVNGNYIQAFKFNQSNTNLTGFEMRLDIHPHPIDWLHFENNFSYVSGKFATSIDGTRNLPAIPATRWITQLRGDFLENGKLIKNLSVMLELDNTFKQKNPFTAFDTETATTGYSLLNAGINADIHHHKKTLLSIYLNAQNITDVAYQNHLSRLKYNAINNATGRQGVFNMGRNFSIKVNIPLNFDWK